MTKWPELLDRDMRRIRLLYPKNQSAEIALEPLSVANMTLAAGSGVKVRDWIEIFCGGDSVGIFRVNAVQPAYGAQDESVSLSHGLCALEDAIIPGEETIQGTVREVLTAMLAHQTAQANGAPLWALGDVEAPDTVKVAYENQNGNVLHAVKDIIRQAKNYHIETDQRTLPWKLHIRALESTPSCEGRLSRNVRTARVNIDDADLCTRVYAKQLDSGYLQLEPNPAWGIVARTLDFDDDAPHEEVERICRAYLEERKEPRVSVEADALDLFDETGEDLDAFAVGRMMRLALPAYGMTVNERITGLQYSDMLNNPQSVVVRMANAIPDTEKLLEDVSGKLDDLHHSSVSHGSAIRGNSKDITNLKDSYEEIVETNKGLTHRLNTVEIDLDAAEADILLRATQAEVTAMDARLKTAEIEIDGANASILLKADVTTVDALGKRVNEAYVRIDGLNSEIELKADKIALNGYVKASELHAVSAKIDNLTSGVTQAAILNTQNFMCNGAVTLLGHSCRWKSKDVVTSVSLKKDYQNVPGGNGVTYTVLGGASVSYRTDTIDYLGY